MASDWYDEMEKAEQEYDAREYELAQEYSRGYEQGRTDAYEDIEEIISDIERCCTDHTENECGEWETLTVDYSKWADVFIRLRQLKEQKK